MGSKTQIRGAPRVGAQVRDEGALTDAVVASYSRLTTDEAKSSGQAAAEAVLPARRALWALAERLVPERLAAALRARTDRADPTGRDGVRELRIALADWLDPPPACRWCRRPIRPAASPDDPPQMCTARRGGDPARREAANRAAEAMREWGIWAEAVGAVESSPLAKARRWTPRPIACRPSKVRKAPGAVARCGTLALYPAGLVSLEVMAAALACPKGASRAYDVACDRDAKALVAATSPTPPRPVDDPSAWDDEACWRTQAAVQALGPAVAGRPLPAALLAARETWRRLRGEHVVANGRAILGVQVRYGVPDGAATRADVLQGGAMGCDRAGLDYDASQARFTTYGAAWIRQGVGEARSSRDLVGTPEWVTSLRGRLDEMLAPAGATRQDLLRAAEALAESLVHDSLPSTRSLAPVHAEALVRLVLPAEVRENLPGTRPPKYIRRPLFPDRSDDAVASLAKDVVKATLGKRRAKSKPAGARDLVVPLVPAAEGLVPILPRCPDTEDPERARERACAWLSRRLGLGESGPAVLTALRHGAPVVVQIGSGGDDDEDAQGTDGAGGSDRQAAVLAAPDESLSVEQEHDDAVRWSAALRALSALQASPGGEEAAEVVRRHHGLDSLAEDRGGQTGESFASIAAAPLSTSGRLLTKEAIRKIYNRAIAALQQIAEGEAPDLSDLAPPSAPSAPATTIVTASPCPTITTAARMDMSRAPCPIVPVDAAAWQAHRDAADAVAW